VTERNIPETVEGLRPFSIPNIITGHCTGWRALHTLANAFGDADVVLLNKSDLVSDPRLGSIEDKLRRTHSSVPLDVILGVSLFEAEDYTADPVAHQHFTGDGYDSVSFVSDQPFAIHKFQDFLNAQLPLGGAPRQGHSPDRRDGQAILIPPRRHASYSRLAAVGRAQEEQIGADRPRLE
jgi:hypothetical protein